MSKPNDVLEQQADLLFENIAGWERRTLERIGKRIKAMEEMPLYDVKSINLIADTKGQMDIIIKDLAKITGQNIQDIQKMYAQALETQHLENQPLYDYRNKTFVPFSENKELQSLVKAYSKTTGETMINLSKTKALGFIDKMGNFKNMQDTIYDVLGKATMTVATGTSDFHTAMRNSIEQLGGSGVRVHYGSGVTRRLDTVVRQNILWGAKQANVAYTEMIGEELDCDGIEIDYHSNPRPSHEFMQGKQFSLVGKKTINGVTYESADEALERLQDYGCLHYKTPIILGISEPRYSDKELAELRRKDKELISVDGTEKTGYEWSQTMRRLETEARKEKEIINTLKASGDNIGVKQHRDRLNAINQKYNQISEQTGISARLDRMSIVKGGAGTSTPQKTLTNSGSGGIIKSEKEQSPRKMKPGNYSVNWSKVQSPEYRKKLYKISQDEKVVSAIETRARWALSNRDGVNTEELYAINLNDGSDIAQITDQHFRKRIERTPQFTKKLNETDNIGNKILLIHNHPDGLPPSIDDINALVKNKNISGITVGHDGSIYYYTRPKKELLKSDYISKIYEYKEFTENTAIEKALNDLQSDFGFIFKKL